MQTETSKTVTTGKAAPRRVYLSDEVKKAFAVQFRGAIKEDGERGKPGWKPGEKAGITSSEHGDLSFDAMQTVAKKMGFPIVTIPQGEPHAGEDAYGVQTCGDFDAMAKNILNHHEQKRAAKYAEQKPEEAVSRLQGRITSFYRKLNGHEQPGSEREKGLVEKGAEFNGGYDFQPIFTALKTISDKADTMSLNRETTREEAQAEHKNLADLEKRLDSDLVISGVDRVIHLLEGVSENMGNAVYNDLRNQALAITSRYTEGKLTVEAALFQTRELRRKAMPMVKKAEAMKSAPRHDGQKPGSTATMREVSDRNRSRNARR